MDSVFSAKTWRRAMWIALPQAKVIGCDWPAEQRSHAAFTLMLAQRAIAV